MRNRMNKQGCINRKAVVLLISLVVFLMPFFSSPSHAGPALGDYLYQFGGADLYRYRPRDIAVDPAGGCLGSDLIL